MKRIISLLLVILIIGTLLVGCKKDKKEEETTNEVSTEVGAEFPDIPAQDNGGKDFTILYPMWSLYERYYFGAETNGEVVNDANFERQQAINAHLGINIVGKPEVAEGGMDAIHVVSDRLQKAVVSGDDPYQLALTHCFVGVVVNITGGNLVDFGTIECLDLDADYWRRSSMKSVALNGKMYLGSGKFLLYEPCVTLFNKDMLNNVDASFNSDDLYQLVRDKKWTVESMMSYAKAVSVDGNDALGEGMGTYGFVCQNNWEISSFMAASDYFVLSKDSQTKKYVATPYSQKLDNIFVQVKTLFDQPYTYHYPYSATSSNISSDIMKEGRAMFATMGLMPAIDAIANSSNKIGILPTPSTVEDQDVKTLDWGGFFVVPVSVKNVELSGAVVELLCYYGQELTYPAFYDKLLGLRTSENAADAEMLDIIFGSMVSDPGLTFIENSDALHQLFYMFSTLVAKNSTDTASFMKAFQKTADAQLKKLN